jgi:hypothetical protein
VPNPALIHSGIKTAVVVVDHGHPPTVARGVAELQPVHQSTHTSWLAERSGGVVKLQRESAPPAVSLDAHPFLLVHILYTKVNRYMCVDNDSVQDRGDLTYVHAGAFAPTRQPLGGVTRVKSVPMPRLIPTLRRLISSATSACTGSSARVRSATTPWIPFPPMYKCVRCGGKNVDGSSSSSLSVAFHKRISVNGTLCLSGTDTLAKICFWDDLPVISSTVSDVQLTSEDGSLPERRAPCICLSNNPMHHGPTQALQNNTPAM